MATITDNNGTNLIPGTGDPDFIFGNGGNDTLLGGLGADELFGGSGSDTASYLDSSTGVTVILDFAGASGIGIGGTAAGDLLFSIENVTGSLFADDISGTSRRNVLTGLGGEDDLRGLGGNDDLFGGNNNDTLDGGTGTDLLNGGSGNDSLIGNSAADTLVGGTGDDIYVVGAGDTISEVGGSGNDLVQSIISFDLTSPAVSGNVENITLTGVGDIDATGNALANRLRGNGGDNEIVGGAGADSMYGGAGNDTFVVDNGGDIVSESVAASGGNDSVISTVTFTLRGAQVANTQTAVENLFLDGNAAINGFGNDLNNIVVGNSAANVLGGFGGNDTMTGRGGADAFVFQSTLNAATNVDTITDFNVADDTIRLENGFFTGLAAGALAVDAFHIGFSAQDAEDRIIYHASTGALLFDADGAGGDSAVRFATLTANPALTNADFTVF